MNANFGLHPRCKSLGTVALVLAAAALLLWSPFAGSHAQHPPSRQLTQGTPVKEWPGKAKRWALVIGVDQYRDGNISALRGAANDAATLARALTQYAGFPADQVILLATDQPEERQPTRINILTYLSNIVAAVPKDGLLLVSFAGHGLERSGQAYLIPSDARLTDDVSLLEESAVSVQRMHDRIRSTGVGQVVVLLDACRNDPGGRADAPNNLTKAYTNAFNFDVRNREVQAYATIYATAVGQRAFEYVEKKQGYFSWAVVEGLKGAAANERGEVTLASLVKYVQDTVPKRVAIDLGAGKQQRPFANIDGYMAADLVVAVSQPPSTVANNAPANETKIDAVAVEREYWETIRNSSDAQDYKDYLQAYPAGTYAVVARAKIRQLEAARNTPLNTQPTNAGGTTPSGPTNAANPGASRPKSFKSQQGIEMVYVPPGRFIMGSNSYDREKPVHEVTINQAFYMGKYEVTQAQWKAVMGNNPSSFKGDNLPVEQVSWDDAVSFIARLNAQNDGYSYRLPTEAEWEYACRAGTTGDYAGDLDAMAWYANNSGRRQLDAAEIARTDSANFHKRITENGGQTHAVGNKLPNSFGLFDMHGNVWEWCQDWYHESYDGAPSDGSAWLSGGEQKFRVLRAGSWQDDATLLRSAYRYGIVPNFGLNSGLGFRVVAVVRTQ